MHSRFLRIALIAGLLGASATVFTPSTAQAAIPPDQFEACLLEKINDARSDVGSPPLAMAFELNVQVRDWSRWMRHNEFRHMYPSERNPILPDDTIIWGENIAWNSSSELLDCQAIHDQLMRSDGHRANLLSENFRFAALGAYGDSSGWWVTELFFDVRGCNGTFCDDDTSVFEGAIEKIAAAGITHGCNPPTNNRYCPDQYVTRGAMAAFLSRALKLPVGASTDFIDDNDSVFESAIEKLAAAGITQGCNPPTNNRYCPDQYVTRGAMAAFLARALGLHAGPSTDFTDDNDSIFEGAIEKLAAAGITHGCNPPTNDRYCPDQRVTRGQMAAFLARALEL